MSKHAIWYLSFVLAVIFVDYIVSLVVERLNLKHVKTELPEEFVGFYDAEKYKKSQLYLRENTGFELIAETISVIITVAFILAGGFGFMDYFARQFGFGEIITGIVFAFSLKFLADFINLPFSVYHTFVIEEKFGFNKTTVRTFVADILKGWALGFAIGGPVLACVIWIFMKLGPMAWFYCWVSLTVIQLMLTFAAPVLIMPIFNKFKPLAEGELETAIRDYSEKLKFKMKGIYTMDGSRRSSKSNAFFTGFGRFRRIVLFDTLIEKHTTNELVSVLAHEMGHYKKQHIVWNMAVSVISTGLMLYIL